MATGIIAEQGRAAGTRVLTLPEMQSIVAGFERSVNSAVLGHRPTKDFVRNVVRRKGAPRCAVRLKRLSSDTVIAHANDLTALFRRYPDDVVAVFPYDIWIGYQTDPDHVIDPVEVATQDIAWTDEWGVRWAHAIGGVGGHPVGHPIQDWSQLDRYLRHSLPDPREPGRLSAAMPILEAHGDSKYCIAQFHMPLWDRLHSLRGFENVFTDFYTNPDETRRLIEAIADFAVDLIAQWGGTGVDAVFLADDWGSQTALMISPGMWREFFRPYYARMFDEAHRHGMDVILHSCGNVMDIVGDLIDIGLDALDPIQDGAMDQEAVAREFGGKVAFCGAVDVQYLLVSATPAAVKDSIRRTIDVLGKRFGNSLIVGPGNMVTPDTPVENLEAMFEACQEQ